MENGKIADNFELGVFTIVGTSEKAQVVRLFPKESCTCPSTGACYHILAAKISIGMEGKQSMGRIQLRRNTRQRRNKKSGRKGRPDIVEISEAPRCYNCRF